MNGRTGKSGAQASRRIGKALESHRKTGSNPK
jgi:hypothetical protein